MQWYACSEYLRTVENQEHTEIQWFQPRQQVQLARGVLNIVDGKLWVTHHGSPDNVGREAEIVK